MSEEQSTAVRASSLRIADYDMGWVEIGQRISAQEFEKFGRRSHDALFYENSSKQIKSEWVAVSDFILWREFGIPYYLDERGKKFCKAQEDFRQICVEKNCQRFGGVLKNTGETEEEESKPCSKEQEQPKEKEVITHFSIHENDYSYAVQPPIRHYLIWSLPRQLTKKELFHVLIEKLNIKESDFWFFENPPALQSIPELFHFQIFTKNPISFPS